MISINLRIAQAEKTIANPTRALVILFRAFSAPALSPPARIHSIPPQTSIKKKSIPAMMRTAWIAKAIAPGTVRLGRLIHWPVAPMLMFLGSAASTGMVSKLSAPRDVAIAVAALVMSLSKIFTSSLILISIVSNESLRVSSLFDKDRRKVDG